MNQRFEKGLVACVDTIMLVGSGMVLNPQFRSSSEKGKKRDDMSTFAKDMIQIYAHTDLLRFLPLGPFIRRFTIQPNSHKSQPSQHRNPDTGNPSPAGADLPAARILIMSEMPDCHFALDVDVGEEWSLVVDAEGENAVLIGGAEGGAEDGAVGGVGDWLKIEAFEGGEHREFELDGVGRVDLQGRVMVV